MKQDSARKRLFVKMEFCSSLIVCAVSVYKYIVYYCNSSAFSLVCKVVVQIRFKDLILCMVIKIIFFKIIGLANQCHVNVLRPAKSKKSLSCIKRRIFICHMIG